MIKNKKLVAFVCAMAMIFTMLSGFTIARADGATITLTTPVLSDDAKTATFDINYSGLTSGVTAGLIEIEMPSQVTNAVGDPDPMLQNYENNKFSYSIASMKSVVSNDTEGKLATVTLTLSEPLASPAEIKIADGSYLGGTDKKKYTVNGTASDTVIPAQANTVAIPADPNAPTPKPTTTAKPADVATEPEDNTEFDPPVSAETSGLNFGTPVVSEDGLTVTLPIDFIGIPNGITAGLIEIEMPAIVTNAVGDPDPMLQNYENNKFSYSIASMKTVVDGTSGTLATLTLTLSKPLTDDIQLTFADGSYIGGTDKVKYTVNGTASDTVITIPASNVIVKGSSEEVEPQDVVDTVDLRDAITKTVTDTPDDTTNESGYFIIPKVTVVDPETKEVVDAEYGEQGDYVAVIGDTVLTPAQYSNLINGHLGAENVKDIVEKNKIKDINDVISNIGLRVYNSTAKISAQLVNKTTKEIENADDKEIEVNSSEPGDNTDHSEKGKIASNVSTSIKSNADKQVATFTVTPAKDEDGKELTDGSKVTITVTKDSYDAVTGTGIAVGYNVYKDNTTDTEVKYVYPALAQAGEEVELPSSVDNKYIVEFTPAKKGTVQYKMTYYDANGDKSEATAEYKISEATTKSGGGSDNKSSGGGAIATGLVDSGSGYLPSLGFDDLGDVEWAQNAINTLAAKKIVSGVGDNKFDPNAALTRAAYAQMLVNAIGHSQDSADVEFDDVPTDAWFYHNVAVAAQLGIVAGFGDGTFRPYDLITREQMALMTQKAAVVMGKSLVGADAGTFTDDADIADWSRDAVYQLSNAGIINGMGDGSFAPQANATRAQAAVIIYQAFVK